MRALCEADWIQGLGSIGCSAEHKQQDQPLPGPEPGRAGGCWFAFDAATRALTRGWTPIGA